MLLDNKNYIVGLPSGEIINCKLLHRQALSRQFLITYKYNIFEARLDCYCFDDKNRDKVIDILSKQIKVGDYIIDTENGEGSIQGIMDNGFIIKFKDRSVYKSIEEMLTSEKIRIY